MLGVDLRSVQEGDIDRSQGIRPGRLRNLRTGLGVEIGDSPSRVRRILGAPTWSGKSKFTPGERVWSYHRIVGSKKDGVEYTALYRFRRNKLTGIELFSDLLGGA